MKSEIISALNCFALRGGLPKLLKELLVAVKEDSKPALVFVYLLICGGSDAIAFAYFNAATAWVCVIIGILAVCLTVIVLFFVGFIGTIASSGSPRGELLTAVIKILALALVNMVLFLIPMIYYRPTSWLFALLSLGGAALIGLGFGVIYQLIPNSPIE